MTSRSIAGVSLMAWLALWSTPLVAQSEASSTGPSSITPGASSGQVSPSSEPLSPRRIRTGRALGTFVGFGVGHFMYRRPLEGTSLAVVQGIGLAMVGAGFSARDYQAGTRAALVGVSLYASSRVWEIVNIWTRPPEAMSEGTGEKVVWYPVLAGRNGFLGIATRWSF